MEQINNEIIEFNETDLEYEFIFEFENINNNNKTDNNNNINNNENINDNNNINNNINNNNLSNIIETIDIKKYFLKIFNYSANKQLSNLTPKQIIENPNNYEIYKNFENDVCQLLRYIYIFDVDTTFNNKITADIIKKGYLARFINLTCFMRDVKGRENTLLSFCLLYFLWKYNSKLSEYLFELFVKKYGSWKDVKKFYRFITIIYDDKLNSLYFNDNKNIIFFLVNFTNKQLEKDMFNYDMSNYSEISLASKWIPREKSEYNKLYEMLSCNYFSHYFIKNKKQSAINKANMNYRKILSTLNKKLDTLQIKQCGKKWSKISPEKQTNANMKLQLNSFLNLTLKNEERYELTDRIICANNFKEYFSENNDTNNENNENNANDANDLINENNNKNNKNNKNNNKNNENNENNENNKNNENNENNENNIKIKNIILRNCDDLFINYLDNERYIIDYYLYF